MGKAVLMSIRPEWCALIANGLKTVEVRKTAPRQQTPYKVYLYCTLQETRKDAVNLPITREEMLHDIPLNGMKCMSKYINGKVWAEFICDRIDKYWLNSSGCRALSQKSCVPANELHIYAQPNEWLFGWHISDLKIYDTVKELRKFIPFCRFSADGECLAGMDIGCGCKRYDCNPDLSLNAVFCDRRMYRPPQSWCYVEEL